MRQNVPRPGQVHSGTMKRPGMNFSGTKYAVDFRILFVKNRKIEIFLKLQQICATISTERIKAEHLMQMNFDINCQLFPKIVKDKNCCFVQEATCKK